MQHVHVLFVPRPCLLMGRVFVEVGLKRTYFMKVCERGNKSGLSIATVDSTVAKEKALDLLFIFFWNSSNPFTASPRHYVIKWCVYSIYTRQWRVPIRVKHIAVANDEFLLWRQSEYKLIQSQNGPIQSQFSPRQSQYRPIQSQYSPNTGQEYSNIGQYSPNTGQYIPYTV